jgi:hypothetical protein
MIQFPVVCHRRTERKHPFVLVTKFVVSYIVLLIMLSNAEAITLHGYGLDGRRIGIRFPARARDVSPFRSV